MYCRFCGTAIESHTIFCPKCGKPQIRSHDDETNSRPSFQELSPESSRKIKIEGKRSGKVIKALGILVLLVLAFTVGRLFVPPFVNQNTETNEETRSEDKEAGEKEAPGKEAENKVLQVFEQQNQYADDMEQVFLNIADSSIEVDSSGALILNVWQNSIYQRDKEETDPYTKYYDESSGSFVFYDDFNQALDSLFSSPDITKKLSEIREKEREITGEMKALRDPPKQYRDQYESLKEVYDAYLALTDLVLNTSGSYASFSEAYDTYQKAIVDCMRAYDFNYR